MNKGATSDTYVLTPHGRVDALQAPQLDAQLQTLLAEGWHHITVDLKHVTYLSSSGLRVLLLAHRRQQLAGGSLQLANPSARVWRVLHMAGLDHVFMVANPPLVCSTSTCLSER